jgi:4-oxalocrotonate tautomerase
MPMITVRYACSNDAADLQQRIADAVGDATAQALGKAADVTAVLVEPAEPSAWFIGGASVARSALAAFWLEVTVTAGTNTKRETSAFVALVFARLGELLGPLDERSYVHVRAADGYGYGYGGRTQSARWAAQSTA